MLRIVHEGGEREAGPGTQVGLDELCRMAAQEMLGVALEAERQASLERHAGAVDGEGRRVVVGNGYARAREITTAAGRVAVQAPRVDDRRPGERYISALLPPYMWRSPKVTEVLPLLYLRGLSTGDFLQLSERCAADIPTVRSDLHAGIARGNQENVCCAGTIEISLEPKRAYAPDRAAHLAFIERNAPTALGQGRGAPATR